MTDFNINLATGAIRLGEKVVCFGYHNTSTVICDDVKIEVTPQMNWCITVAMLGGTSLRIFSISREEYNSISIRYAPWRQTADRVWFMATQKSVEGHLRKWSSEKTFGVLFEEIANEQTILEIMNQTTDLCISYFLCHKDNDLYEEVKESCIYQTLIWNGTKFIGPHVPEWTTPPAQIKEPLVIGSSLVHKQNLLTMRLEEGRPILFTAFDDTGMIMSIKYIMADDEYFRRFRCRSHSLYAALFILSNLFEKSPQDAELQKEFSVAIEYFTKKDLQLYHETVEVAKNNFMNDVRNKITGMYVVFPPSMYKATNIKNSLFKSGAEDLIWKALCNTTNMAAIEEFFRFYPTRH